jgi:predicted ferric reductase
MPVLRRAPRNAGVPIAAVVQPVLDLWSRELHVAGMRAWLPAAAALAIALPLWLADWPALSQPAGVRGLLRALGILAGVAGTALWVTSLALMLRFPVLDRRLGGLERQYFAHHLTGTLAYLMLLAHPLLLVAAASIAAPAAAAVLAAPWGQPLAVLAGWIALAGLMLMMVATFFSSLPYARWKQLHAASGVAYLFAFAHVAGLLPAAGEGRGGTVLLLAAMGAGLAAIGVRRLLDRGALGAQRFRVECVERASPSTVEVTLAPLPGAAPLAFAPGQFVFVAFDRGPRYAGCHEYHPFTISSAPSTAQFRVMVKALGDCTTRMQHLQAGVVARVQGPYGALFRATDFTRRQLWLGGGIGITPFLPMAAALPADAAGVDLYYLARDAGEALGLDALRAAAAKNPRLRVFALLANESPQAVRAAVQASSAPLAAREVYLCGPPGMLQAALAWLADAGVPPARIHAERFDFR